MTQEITTVEQIDRVETGAMRINDDWCGVFIRGDNAKMLLGELQQLKKDIHPFNLQMVNSLVRIIEKLSR